MFQLVHLYFTQPRSDPTAFAAIAGQAKAFAANESASPDAVFNRTIEAAISGNSLRRQPETPATIARAVVSASQGVAMEIDVLMARR
jgi:zinc protease